MTVSRMHPGLARSAPAIEKAVKRLYGEEKTVALTRAMDDMMGVDALARLLDQAMSAATSKDGRLDLRDMAAFVLREIRIANPGLGRP